MSAQGEGKHAGASRLLAVDALRGIAALAVVLFHFTTRFQDLYGGAGSPTVAFPNGHYGVNLFFVISGFVIFMTLERTKRPMDFVVSRFSRLFPSYWLAVALTFIVVSSFGLPGKEVTLGQALANGLMVHGLLGVPHVDGVYWTLEIEMLFYAWMLLLFVSGQLSRVHQALWALLSLRLVYVVMAKAFGIDLSWTLSHLLILKYLPWFALGICVYQLSREDCPKRSLPFTVALALVVLAAADGWRIALMAAFFASLVWLAATGRANWLANRVLVFFGAISYPLYLLHENIGWVAMRAMQRAGWSFDVSAAAALLGAIALAAAVTFAVERPAMKWVRLVYERRRAAARAVAV
jgi:peptidoglycan/LPS O-acetylase OafA/YrhL